jgi:hypothetical protein
LDEAILARDYAALEGLDEDEVLASIRVRRILGTLSPLARMAFLNSTATPNQKDL